MPTTTQPQEKESYFSFTRFSIFVTAQFALLLLGVKVFLPGVWRSELAAGPVAIGATFLGLQVFNCFCEFFFHRYVLHTALVRWLKAPTEKHRKHHGLTYVRLGGVVAGNARLVRNAYPITEPKQYESAKFPHYVLPLFYAVFTPLFVFLDWLFPNVPFVLSGYAAVTWSYAFYEIFHVVEHLPYENFWKKRIEHPRFGKMWTKIYGFHQMHHANPSVNEAIGGFFGFPLADIVLRTYKQPRELLLHGALATKEDFRAPVPRALIVWLDRVTKEKESKLLRSRAA